jgi:hypothetical protein
VPLCVFLFKKESYYLLFLYNFYNYNHDENIKGRKLHFFSPVRIFVEGKSFAVMIIIVFLSPVLDYFSHCKATWPLRLCYLLIHSSSSNFFKITKKKLLRKSFNYRKKFHMCYRRSELLCKQIEKKTKFLLQVL